MSDRTKLVYNYVEPREHDPSCTREGVFTNRHNCDRCAAIIKRLDDRVEMFVRVPA
jgi:hypothetical protein